MIRIYGPGSNDNRERRAEYDTLLGAIRDEGGILIAGVKNGINGLGGSVRTCLREVAPFENALLAATGIQAISGLVSVQSNYPDAEKQLDFRIRLDYEDERSRDTLTRMAEDRTMPAFLRNQAALMRGFIDYVAMIEPSFANGESITSNILNGDSGDRRYMKKLWRKFGQAKMGYANLVTHFKGHFLKYEVARRFAEQLSEGALFWQWPVPVPEAGKRDGGREWEYSRSKPTPGACAEVEKTYRDDDAILHPQEATHDQHWRMADLILAARRPAITAVLDDIIAEDVDVLRRPDLFIPPRSPQEVVTG